MSTAASPTPDFVLDDALLAFCSRASAAPRRQMFAARMRELRLHLGRKQLSLASAAGVTVAAVSMWEAGKRVPAGRNLDRILRAFEQAGASREQVADLRWNWEEVKLSAAQRSTVDSAG